MFVVVCVSVVVPLKKRVCECVCVVSIVCCAFVCYVCYCLFLLFMLVCVLSCCLMVCVLVFFVVCLPFDFFIACFDLLKKQVFLFFLFTVAFVVVFVSVCSVALFSF